MTYAIVTYLGWCGVDVRHEFDSRADDDQARAFLDDLPGGASLGNFYYVAADQRDEFERFMKALKC